jgi:hypothetical protein
LTVTAARIHHRVHLAATLLTMLCLDLDTTLSHCQYQRNTFVSFGSFSEILLPEFAKDNVCPNAILNILSSAQFHPKVRTNQRSLLLLLLLLLL